MNTSWKLQDAKAKFSQVVENALKIGPQYVTRRGQEAVVILSGDCSPPESKIQKGLLSDRGR